MKKYYVLGLGVLAAILWMIQLEQPSAKIESRYTYPESKFITIQGTKIHYRKTGQGPVVVLLHGVTSSLHTYDHWQKKLSENFTVVSLDLPAFGLTGPMANNDYRLESYMNTLDELFNALQIDSLYLGGNSFGGFLSWTYALKHPEKVKKLILLDAHGVHPNLPLGMMAYKTPVINWFAQYITPKFLVKTSVQDVYYNDELVTDSLTERYFDLLTSHHVRENFPKVLEQLHNPNNPTIESMRGLKMPTLIMWGKYDTLFPLAVGQKYHQLIAGSVLKTYSSGHVPMEENPEETVLDVLAFLKQPE